MKRTALVTGALGGIGTQICRSLYDDGFEVFANCLPFFDEQDAWLEEQEKDGYHFNIIEFDVSDFENTQVVLTELNKEFNIDTLVNCAGITRDSFLKKMSEEDWYNVIETNLNSVFNVTRFLINSMIEKNFGRVISISSVNGIKGQIGQTNYSAAKAGIIGFTKALAQEVARHNITVNAIAPGYVETKMVAKIKPEVLNGIVESIPMKRLARAEEIAHLVSYLASEKAGYITGEVISINGGLHM